MQNFVARAQAAKVLNTFARASMIFLMQSFVVRAQIANVLNTFARVLNTHCSES